MAISVSFPFSSVAQPEDRGTHSAVCWLSLPHLVTNGSGLQSYWLPVFTELYNSSIAHSISLEWHVWSSSSGNNCHEVHRSLSSVASVYDCIVGLYLVPYCQQSPPTRFLPITAHRNVLLPHSLEWHVWPGRRSIYNTSKSSQVFARPRISISSNTFTKTLWIVLKTPVTIGITIFIVFYSVFLNSPARYGYSSFFFSLFFSFILWSTVTAKATIWWGLIFYGGKGVITWSGGLVEIRWLFSISQS